MRGKLERQLLASVRLCSPAPPKLRKESLPRRLSPSAARPFASHLSVAARKPPRASRWASPWAENRTSQCGNAPKAAPRPPSRNVEGSRAMRASDRQSESLCAAKDDLRAFAKEEVQKWSEAERLIGSIAARLSAVTAARDELNAVARLARESRFHALFVAEGRAPSLKASDSRHIYKHSSPIPRKERISSVDLKTRKMQPPTRELPKLPFKAPPPQPKPKQSLNRSLQPTAPAERPPWPKKSDRRRPVAEPPRPPPIRWAAPIEDNRVITEQLENNSLVSHYSQRLRDEPWREPPRASADRLSRLLDCRTGTLGNSVLERERSEIRTAVQPSGGGLASARDLSQLTCRSLRIEANPNSVLIAERTLTREKTAPQIDDLLVFVFDKLFDELFAERIYANGAARLRAPELLERSHASVEMAYAICTHQLAVRDYLLLIQPSFFDAFDEFFFFPLQRALRAQRGSHSRCAFARDALNWRLFNARFDPFEEQAMVW